MLSKLTTSLVVVVSLTLTHNAFAQTASKKRAAEAKALEAKKAEEAKAQKAAEEAAAAKAAEEAKRAEEAKLAAEKAKEEERLRKEEERERKIHNSSLRQEINKLKNKKRNCAWKAMPRHAPWPILIFTATKIRPENTAAALRK